MTTEQCKTFLQLLDDYLDRALEPERQAEIERHLEQCARCRHELEAHQRIIASLKQLEKKSAPVTLHTEVLARLQGRAASIPWRSRIQSLFSPRRLRVAMEIAAVFIVVFIGWQIFNSPSLQITLRDRKATTPGEARYLGTALETYRAAPLSSVPATLGETVVKVEAEVSKETKEEEPASGITTTELPEMGELKREVYESLARPVAPQVEGVDVVPSTALPDKVAGDKLMIQEEMVRDRTALAPAPSRDEVFMFKEKFEFREAPEQETPPVQISLSEAEGIPTGEEKLGTFGYYADRLSVPPKSMPSEEAERLGELRLDFKAKPEAKVADYLYALSPEAHEALPDVPRQPPIARGEIVAKNGILMQSELAQPLGSPAPRISINGDVDKKFATKRLEKERTMKGGEGTRIIHTFLVISAAPGQALRFQGAFVSVSDLSQQSKVVERILHQNRGKVLSIQESKNEIKMMSLIPISEYTKFVDQLERKGFVIKREILPKLARLDRAEKALLKGHYQEIVVGDDGRPIRTALKRERMPETPRRGLVESQPWVQVAPTPVVISESSFSITIIIQGASPSPEATP